jgi:nucleoside-diphosphate-sugar epimerase
LTNHGVPGSVEQLEQLLSEPSPEVVELMGELPGDIMFLGVGGKMGPTMARMARRASDLAGVKRRVIGVSRFSTPALRERLESWSIETVACDLLDLDAVSQLPDASLVISMSGYKFGTAQNPEMTWATNCLVPTLVCQRFRHSRIVTFSTGNVYGYVTPSSGGSVETDVEQPDGEYAMAAIGRERMYAYFSKEWGIPTIILRLNYATELRYGVLVDLAQQVQQGGPIDVTMGYVNVIWLGDANKMSLLALRHATTPARVVNLAGDEVLSTREAAQRLAERMETTATCTGKEAATALLSNGQLGYQLWGKPAVNADEMICWTADWIAHGRPTLGKPTHFEVTDGKF